jgi:diguanylate cyclase (GGDEF)-like protein
MDWPEQNMTVDDYQGLFDHAPVSLWLEDYSQVKRFLDDLRAQGVNDLATHLDAHPEAIEECVRLIKVIDVNRFTLDMFGAASKEELINQLDRVFRDEMRLHFRAEMLDMWAGKRAYEREGINYALDGRPIDILLRWSILPGHESTWQRALVSLSDITDRKRAEQQRTASENHARGLFEHSPVSLWVEDYSLVKRFLDELRSQGVEALEEYLVTHPEAVSECMAKIRVLDVNQHTLALFGAKSKEILFSHLDQVFRDEMRKHFAQELLDMWNGRLAHEGEGINYSLSGEPIDIFLRWSVLPGYEETWELALVSIVDITARKKAEKYLQYLGAHDVLTGLYNRAFFEEELHRAERGRRFPVSIIGADLNGLKVANDRFGHEAGDALLRRAAEVLRAAFRGDDVAARIGGDEFAVIMPTTGEQAAEQAVQRLLKLVELNNQFYQGPTLSVALGTATAQAGMPMADVMRIADDRMYVNKRQYHRQHSENDQDRSGAGR